MTRRSLARALFVFLACTLFQASLRAEGRALLLPSAVETTAGELLPARDAEDPALQRLGAELDRAVSGALEDMALVAESSRARTIASDADLPGLAAGRWVFAPRFSPEADGARVRLVAVRPGAKVLLVREEELDRSELAALSVRAVVMVRDLVEAGRGTRRDTASRRPTRFESLPAPHQSTGRPILALHSALLGGYLGFSVQRASSSPDSRLVYPMVALGAGLGLGGSLLVADEWDISESDAWYLGAGIYWPGAAGFLLAEGYGARLEDRWLYGLLGATGGLGLSAAALATNRIGPGGAALAHSGGAFGMLFGALTEIGVRGESEGTPARGMGYGAGLGVVAAGTLATVIEMSSARVLLIDLSASLGGLGGAALASPLLFADRVDRTRTRLWLGAVGLGTVAGGLLGYALTTDSPAKSSALEPYAGVDPALEGASFSAGVRGTW